MTIEGNNTPLEESDKQYEEPLQNQLVSNIEATLDQLENQLKYKETIMESNNQNNELSSSLPLTEDEQDYCMSFNVAPPNEEGDKIRLHEIECQIEKSLSKSIDPEIEEGIRAVLNRGAELLGINIWSDQISEENELQLSSSPPPPQEAEDTYSDEINGNKNCLENFEQVMTDYKQFVSNFMSTNFEDGEDDEENKMLENEQETSAALHEKFIQICQLEDEGLSGISNEELRQSLHEKIARVRDLQKQEKEEIAQLHDQITKHLDLEAKLAELSNFEDNLYSMDSDIKEISRILSDEIETSFPEIESTFGILSIENADEGGDGDMQKDEEMNGKGDEELGIK
jgi:hypothetical protein